MAQLPDPLLNSLRCIRCKNFLSCGPVSVLKDGYSLCGRCHIKNSNTFEATAYEAVAEYFLFRCKNFEKHCAYLLNWNDVLTHEEECAFSGTCSIMCNNPGALFKSDNKLDLNQDMGVFKVPEQILQTLTCSACGYYLSSLPIFVNPDGLSTCHRCFAIKEHVPPDFVRHAALEKILSIMLFPCIYRTRGCTQFFRFGIDTTSHEKECAYAQTRKPKQMRSFTDANGKVKGVIETHSGHIVGTITPNSISLLAQEKFGATGQGTTNIEPLRVKPNKIQGAFFNELMDHREHLVENKWRSSMIEPRTPDNQTPRMNIRSEPIMREPSLSRKESLRNELWTPDTPTRRNFDENREPMARRESQRGNFDYPSMSMRPSLSHPPIQEDYYDNDVDQRFQSYNSISESPNTPDSPISSVNLNNFSYNQPLKLNAQDLAHSNSFSYLERFDKPMERTGSAASDRPTTQYNGSFRN